MEHITDHAAQAAGRLAEQYKNKPKLGGVVAAFAEQIQSLEDVLWSLFLDRLLENATGAQLDQYGVVVKLARQGMDDDTYRLQLSAKILLNRSSGTLPDVLGVLRLITPVGVTITVEEQFPAAFLAHLEGAELTPASAALVNSFLKRAKVGGVRALMTWWESPSTQMFRLDSGPGLDQGHLAGVI